MFSVICFIKNGSLALLCHNLSSSMLWLNWCWFIHFRIPVSARQLRFNQNSLICTVYRAIRVQQEIGNEITKFIYVYDLPFSLYSKSISFSLLKPSHPTHSYIRTFGYWAFLAVHILLTEYRTKYECLSNLSLIGCSDVSL